jgi:SAM-dependent methyltransferase
MPLDRADFSAHNSRMLLTITTSRPPATDLGWLLHKHPAKVQAFDLSFGQAHVFYPEATEDRCTAALLLSVDPIALARPRAGRPADRFSLQPYVNDRPYVANSFLSVAIGRVYGSALGGRCKDRPELTDQVLPLEVCLPALPCRGGAAFLRRLFEPLEYEVSAESHVLDAKFPEWGESNIYTVTLRCRQRLQDLLTHLYVLIPVLDNDKHYWVGQEELEKLLRRGEGWLVQHPERKTITTRYLKHQRRLAREALARLAEEDHPDPDAEQADHEHEEAALEAAVALPSPAVSTPDGALTTALLMDAAAEDALPSPTEARYPSLNTQRLATVLAVLRAAGAQSVVDLGCGEGKLLRLLLDDKQFERVLGMDVSLRSLKLAADRLQLDRLSATKRQRIDLMHGSLMYRDERLRLDTTTPYDAATCVEVIEHLDPPRLAAFERAVFEFARPRSVVITTPNREYNVRFESLPAGSLRHRDHRFEWTRKEFESWASGLAERFDYEVRFLPVGPEDVDLGSPTQMGVFVTACN